MSRIALALLAVALAVAAVVGAFVLLTADRSTDVGPNVMVNPEGVVEANNTPTIVRNPRQPQNVVVAHRVDRPNFSANLQWSTDGGATWQPTVLPLPPGKDRPFAPDAAFAPDGTLYVTYVHLEGEGNVPANLWMATSSDSGRTLSAPVSIAGPLSFQARLAVEPSGAVHVTWLAAKEVALYRLAGGPHPIVSSRSTDRGRTFSPPVQVSDPERQRVGAASPVIDANGQLVVLYQDFRGDRRDFEYLQGPVWEEPFGLVLTRSTDGGKSFSRGVELESGVVPTKRFLVFLPDFPSLAADSGDGLYVSWADGRHGDEDVFVRRSEDGGRSWGGPVRVNDNPRGDGTAQYLPRLAVAPGGRVDVLFLDRRRDRANVMTDATLASSHDRGRSFSNARASSEAFSSRVGPSAAEEFGVDFGSRLGLTSSDGAALAAWTDSRLGSEDTGRQDIMAAAVNVPEPAGGLARGPVIAGLLVLSVLALTGSYVRGRSSQASSVTVGPAA
ncbi:MAG TPA: exo-alpha-sialidase [Acidimicrobiales bacterium]|nr:exo-alpha-sialidase [Acidimicrobiales bacterium]